MRSFWGRKSRCPGFLCLLLALATAAVFWPVARFDFVNYDDSDYVTANAHVQSGLKWANVRWAFTTGHASNWHPLTWLSHSLDCQLFGQSAGAHHLASAGFHLANTLLLFLVLRQMTGALWRSALVAALFALHPLHVESVAWVSERKDVLSGFFFLLTLWAYSAYVSSVGGRGAGEKSEILPPSGTKSEIPQSGTKPEIRSPDSATAHRGPRAADYGLQTTQRALSISHLPSSISHLPSAIFYLLALLLFALGLMSKPMLVTLPFVLLLLDYWPLGRVSGVRCQVSEEAGRARPHASAPLNHPTNPVRRPSLAQALRLVLEKLPFLALSAASSVITFVVQRKGGAVSTSLSAGERIANALVSYLRYIGKMFWPVELSVLYPHPGHWPTWHVAASACALVAVSFAVVALARSRQYLAVGWLWFCGMLIPAIGLVQVGIQSMADRYTYLPLIGLFIMLVWGLGELGVIRTEPADSSTPPKPVPAEQSKIDRNVLTVAATFLKPCLAVLAILSVVACAVLTGFQLQHWRNSEALFQHAVRVTKNNYLAYNNLGFYLSGKGKVAEAMENYRKSLEINPAYEDAHNNLGYALAGQKKYAEAIGHYEVALRIRPKHVEVHNNLGNALAEIGKVDEAIVHYLFVLQQKPDHADAHNNLGIALAMQGKLDEAMIHFQAAIRFKPNYASAHSNLGNALAAQHKLDEAIKEYQESLRLKPDDAQAHNNLGNALAESGKPEEANGHYLEAIRLNADNPEAHFNLGMVLLRQGKRAEAAAHFSEALRLKPDYAEAKRQLGLISTPTPN